MNPRHLPLAVKGTTVTNEPMGVVATPIREVLPANFVTMIEAVPLMGGDAWESILDSIAEAETPEALDAAWNGAGLRQYLDVPLEVRGIERGDSDYEDGLPYYLLISGVRTDTGETVVCSTGAVSVVAQLVKAYAMGWLPLRVIARQAKKPTANGYFPLHLEIIGRQRS